MAGEVQAKASQEPAPPLSQHSLVTRDASLGQRSPFSLFLSSSSGMSPTSRPNQRPAGFSIFFLILFVYLSERDRKSTSRGAAEAEGEADSLLGREQDTGLDLRTLDHDLS